jgi:hypothetical protein
VVGFFHLDKLAANFVELLLRARLRMGRELSKG